MNTINRRTFIGTTLSTAVAMTLARQAQASSDRDEIYRQIEQRHDESVQRLQDWIAQPSIAAENRGITEGCELMMQMLREAGFQQVESDPTDGQPGVFATLDAGAQAHGRPLLHVRREAVRPGRVVARRRSRRASSTCRPRQGRSWAAAP